MFTSFPNIRHRRFWLAWAGWILLILCIHLSTITISPPVWMDEVQIIDFGRTAIDPSTDWSMAWDTTRNSTTVNPIYLGSLIQNIAFSLSGFNIVFPRLLGIIGAIIASTACLCLLLSYGHDRIRSALLSTILLLHPIFVAGYRGDRLDCWVFAASFLSCLALQKSTSVAGSEKKFFPVWTFIAGCIAAIGFSFWFSFVLLLPLILWQIIYCATRSDWKILFQGRKELFSTLFFWSAGFASCLFVLYLPILVGQAGSLANLFQATARATSSMSIFASFLTFISLFKTSPFLLLLTCLCLFARPRVDLLCTLLVAFAGILSSYAYEHRVVYIVPYMIVFCSFGLHNISLGRSIFGKSSFASNTYGVVIGLAVASSVMISLIIRPLNAVTAGEFRSLGLLESVAKQAIGPGRAKVLIEPWEFYVPGRKLNWKMYNATYNYFRPDQIAAMDFLILHPNSELLLKLPPNQFVRVGDTWLRRPQNTQTQPSHGHPGYGPYIIFKNSRLKS